MFGPKAMKGFLPEVGTGGVRPRPAAGADVREG